MTAPNPRQVFGSEGLHVIQPPVQAEPVIAETAKVIEPPPITDDQAFRTECEVDGKEIQVMSFKGTGVCSEYCRKVRDGEIVDERPVR